MTKSEALKLRPGDRVRRGDLEHVVDRVLESGNVVVQAAYYECIGKFRRRRVGKEEHTISHESIAFKVE